MQAGGCAGSWRVLKVDLLKVLLGERVKGLPRTVGGGMLGHFGFSCKKHRGDDQRGNKAGHRNFHLEGSIFISMFSATATGWPFRVAGLNRYWRTASSAYLSRVSLMPRIILTFCGNPRWSTTRPTTKCGATLAGNRSFGNSMSGVWIATGGFT